MKLTILQQDLLPPVQAVARSTGAKNLPVLQNILLSTAGNKLKLSATNLEIGVIKVVGAEVLTQGEITVPARTFLEVLSSLGEQKLELEVKAEQLKVSTKNFTASINGILASEFPAIPLSSEKGVVVSCDLLAKTLPQITFAAASDEGRPVLTGILTEIKKETIEFVATDGFRLAHKKASIETSGPVFKALIPRRTFEEVTRLLGEEAEEKDKEVELTTSDSQNQVIFKIGQTQLSSRLIEGQFPAWEKIIPTEFENRTILDKGQFLKAVKLASVFARDASNIIKVETLEGKVKLSSEAKELGSQETEVEAQAEGGSLVIAFNSKFLIDVLSVCPTSQVLIEFSGSLSPALIKPVGEEGLEYVVMPIRLS